MYDYGIFIGRFQPFHNIHLEMLRKTLDQSKKVIVVVGSYNQARNVKNPWSGTERIAMIMNALSEKERDRVVCLPVRDVLYNDNQWIAEVQHEISEMIHEGATVALFGHATDSSSYYLKLFPQWDFVDTKVQSPTHASDLRRMYFTKDLAYKKSIPANVSSFITDFATTGAYDNLHDEYHHLCEYKDAWRGAPFPPIFVTTDAVVVKSGHILVVRRRGSPGKGLVALPGGFLQQEERIIDGCIRELKEETGIKMPASQLKDSVVENHVFDHPARSLRGRTITHAFCIDLGSGELPQVKGMDDADKSWWMAFHDVYGREDQFFDDHFHMIQYFIQRF